MKKIIGIMVLGLLIVIIALGVVDRFFVSRVQLSYDGEIIELKELMNYDHPFEELINDQTKLIALGDVLDLEIDHETIKDIEIHDYILNEDGRIRFSDLDEDSIEIIFDEKGYDLMIHPHRMILLSSAIEDKIYRGIELTLIEEDRTISYLFVIQTNAYDE